MILASITFSLKVWEKNFDNYFIVSSVCNICTKQKMDFYYFCSFLHFKRCGLINTVTKMTIGAITLTFEAQSLHYKVADSLLTWWRTSFCLSKKQPATEHTDNNHKHHSDANLFSSLVVIHCYSLNTVQQVTHVRIMMMCMSSLTLCGLLS